MASRVLLRRRHLDRPTLLTRRRRIPNCIAYFRRVGSVRVAMDHLASQRLRDVAEDDLVFTDEEFIHLIKCAKCFQAWAAFIQLADMNDCFVARPT